MNEKTREQRRIVKGGALTCLTWLVLIAVFLGVYFSAEPILRRLSVSPEGEDMVVFANFAKLRNQIIWGGAFTALALLCAVGVGKSASRSVIAAGLTLIAIGVFAFQMWYGRFAALRFESNSAIALQYLWPRPSTLLDVREVRALEIIESLEHTVGPANDMYQLAMETARGRFQSMRTESGESVRSAIERIKRMQNETR